MFAKFAHYRKTIAAEVVATMSWIYTCYLPDGHVDRWEWYGLALAQLTALGVYTVKNDPKPEDPPAVAQEDDTAPDDANGIPVALGPLPVAPAPDQTPPLPPSETAPGL